MVWQANGQFTLAPAYDMLPMLYQPTRQGELVERHFDASVLDRLELRHLQAAREMARAFWQAVEGDARISPGFAAIARQHQASLP